MENDKILSEDDRVAETLNYFFLNMVENLDISECKVDNRKSRSLRKNSVMLVHQNENIKPAYLEEANKVFNDPPNEIREDICAMSFSMFKSKLKNYLFDKTIAKILSCA